MNPARGKFRSLRTILVTGAVGFTMLLAVVAVGLAVTNLTMRATLDDATVGFLEEQRTADRLLRAVNRQLMAASQLDGIPGLDLVAEFRAAGDEAYEELRSYLFRDLDFEQRLQLEALKEEHQRLEVAASQAFGLYNAGRADEAAASVDAMLTHAVALQDAVDDLLRLREAELQELSARHTATYRYLSAGVGLFALLLLATALFAGRFLHRRLARPVTALRDAATAIGRGEFEVRVRTHHNDEFAEVADAFNRMADSLATAKASLEDRNAELQAALKELRTTQVELIHSEKMSATGRMMAGLAHELNNPLASLLGYAELLDVRLDEGREPSEEELRRDFVEPILKESVRARDLVRNFLRFSRRPGEELSAVRLREPLRVVVGLRAYAFKQAGLDLAIDDDTPDGPVRAEAQRLQQIFLDIINNAFDAMEPAGRGTLRVSGERRGDRVIVHFDDDGPGVADAQRVFEPFFTTKGVGKGTGLGLALVHRFMEGCGGKVTAENRPEGGARITLTFAAAGSEESRPGKSRSGESAEPAVAPVATSAGAPATSAGAPETPAGAPDPSATAPETSAAAPDRTPPAVPPGAWVLVVEDEAPLRDLHKRLLTRIAANVVLAEAAEEARRILEDRDIDLIISDVKMPGGSGLDLFRWVQEHRPELADRFLFVTGDVGDPEIAFLAAAEPHRFVHKPFQMAEYLERIATVLH